MAEVERKKMNLLDKAVLVTGGSNGIGLSIAEMAKQKGGKVIICGRNKDKLENVSAKYGFTGYVCDVSDEAQVVNMFANIKNDFGRLDALINNAGYGYFAEIDKVNADELKQVLNTNIVGAILCGREAAKIFKNQNSGNIVNIASTAALKGFAYGTPYVATKFALRGITECWRAELRKYNVRVILINPSEVQTDFKVNSGRENSDYNATKLQSKDIAFSVISALEMNDRGFITELTVFATNPKE